MINLVSPWDHPGLALRVTEVIHAVTIQRHDIDRAWYLVDPVLFQSTAAVIHINENALPTVNLVQTRASCVCNPSQIRLRTDVRLIPQEDNAQPASCNQGDGH